MSSSPFVRYQWVFLRDGHCIAVLGAGAYPTEDKAWRDMYPTRSEEREAHLSGVSCRKVDHDVYMASYMPCQTGQCTHGAVSAHG